MKGSIGILALFLVFLIISVSQAVTLSSNTTFINSLKSDLNDYHYTKNYKINQFDCADTSMLVKTLLEKKGYRPLWIVDLEKEHAWLEVPDKAGNVVVIETVCDYNDGVGKIIEVSQIDRYLAGSIALDPWALLEKWGIDQRVKENLRSYRPG